MKIKKNRKSMVEIISIKLKRSRKSKGGNVSNYVKTQSKRRKIRHDGDDVSELIKTIQSIKIDYDIDSLNNWMNNPVKGEDYELWYNESFDYVVGKSQNANDIINIVKKRLPKLHIVHYKNLEFDHLLYLNMKKLGFQNNLEFTKIYEQISDDDLNKLNETILKERIIRFLQDYIQNIFTLLFGVVRERKLISEQDLYNLKVYHKDILKLSNLDYFDVEIKEGVYNFHMDRMKSENYFELENTIFLEWLKKKNMFEFVNNCFKDIEEISLIKHIDKKSNRIQKIVDHLSKDLNDEPFPPYLKQKPEDPTKPTKESIEAEFTNETGDEIEKIFQMRMLKYKNIMKEIESYPQRLRNFNEANKKYMKEKEEFDKKIQKIKHLSIDSNLTTEDAIIKRKEILQNLLGDQQSENNKRKLTDSQICQLGENEDLISPFTTNFSPLNEYPLYQLETIVKIHGRNDDGNIIRTDCGNAIDLYNYIIDFLNEGRKPKHPILDQDISYDDINEIFRMIPHIVENFEKPDINLYKVIDPELNLHFEMIDGNPFSYYEAYLTKTFGGGDGYKTIVHHICTFPIVHTQQPDSVSTDRTGSGMAVLFDQLFDTKRLLHNYNPPYCIISEDVSNTFDTSYIAIPAKIIKMKSREDWENNRTKDEIISLFNEMYDDLTRF